MCSYLDSWLYCRVASLISKSRSFDVLGFLLRKSWNSFPKSSSHNNLWGRKITTCLSLSFRSFFMISFGVLCWFTHKFLNNLSSHIILLFGNLGRKPRQQTLERSQQFLVMYLMFHILQQSLISSEETISYKIWIVLCKVSNLQSTRKSSSRINMYTLQIMAKK